MHRRADAQGEPPVLAEGPRTAAPARPPGAGPRAVRARRPPPGRGGFAAVRCRFGDGRGQGRQGDERDGLVAGVRDRDPVRRLRARRRRVDQHLLQQGLRHRPGFHRRAVLAPFDPRHDDLPVRCRAETRQQHRRRHPQPRRDLAGAAPVCTSSRTSWASRRRTARAASRRSRSTAMSWVTPCSRSSRAAGQSPASASTASSQSDSTVSRTSLTAGAAPRPVLRIGKSEYVVPPTAARCGPRRPMRVAARCSPASSAPTCAGRSAPAPAICRPVGDSTQARRSRSEPSRSRTTSGPPPAGPDVISLLWRSTTAARSPARSPDTCRTTCSVMVANATDSFTANSGRRWRKHASTRSSGTGPSSASPAARPATPAADRIRTNGSESAGPRRQARPVSTSSPPDR